MKTRVRVCEAPHLAVIAKTANETLTDATHWSRETMAAAMGISASSVGRIRREAGLKPHIVKSFKISNDPRFEAKVTDIVGLYMNPPDRALVLCVDEKSQIQALDRTQPGLADLEDAIHDYLMSHNAKPSPSCGPRPPRPFWRRSAAHSTSSKPSRAETKR